MKKLNRYERIMNRPDKMRPHFLCELKEFFPMDSKGMVMNLKVLTPLGNTIHFSWNEKDFPPPGGEKK